MSWVSIATRKSLLRSRISQLNNKLMRISQEIIDLQSYGASISDGKITYDEMAELPSTYHGTGMAYNETAAQVASQSAQNKTNAYMQMNQINDQNTYNTCFNSYLESELKEFAKIQMQRIEVEENRLEQEKTKIETQVSAAEAEYQSLEKTLGQEIQQSAIKLSLNG